VRGYAEGRREQGEREGTRTYREPQQTLRSRHDERFAVVPHKLPSKDVEVVGSGSDVDDVEVRDEGCALEWFVGKLEEALDPGAAGEGKGRRCFKDGKRKERETHEECSGPAPSKPCGRRRVSPLCKPHFVSPEPR
jgi:hypothetical protein